MNRLIFIILFFFGIFSSVHFLSLDIFNDSEVPEAFDASIYYNDITKVDNIKGYSSNPQRSVIDNESNVLIFLYSRIINEHHKTNRLIFEDSIFNLKQIIKTLSSYSLTASANLSVKYDTTSMFIKYKLSNYYVYQIREIII